MSKRSLNSFLYYTSKERRGSIALLIIILLLIITPFIIAFFGKNKNIRPGEYQNEIAAIQLKTEENKYKPFKSREFDNYERPNYHSKNKWDNSTHINGFYFDPNTLPMEGWEKIGLKEKQISTIQNYLSKGGRFKNPEDIKKIWGIKTDEAEQLIPWIRIEAIAENNKPVYEKKN